MLFRSDLRAVLAVKRVSGGGLVGEEGLSGGRCGGAAGRARSRGCGAGHARVGQRVEHRRWEIGAMPQLRPLEDLPLEGEVVVGHPRGRPRGRSRACSTRSRGGTPRTGERPLRGPRARILLSTDRWPDEEVDGVMGGGWPCGEGEVVGIAMGEGSVWQ